MVVVVGSSALACSTPELPVSDDTSVDVDDVDDDGGRDASTEANRGASSGDGEGAGDEDGSEGGNPLDPEIAESSRVRRITRVDLDRVLSDLLYLEAAVAQTFPDELPTLHGYFNDDALAVDGRFFTQLTHTAESLAARVRSESAAYTQLVGCTTADSACRDEFLRRFLTRAYRRSISDAELQAYQRLFDAGADLVGSGDAFADGVQLAVEAAIQSPHFIYRIERGTLDSAGERQLTAYEFATRLSFLLWGSIPDDELLAAADSEVLETPEAVAAMARRMTADPRATARILDFHRRWMQMDALQGVSRDPAVFPEFSAELVADVQQEFALFVEEVTVHEQGGVAQLLTAPFTFVNGNTDRIYGTGTGFDQTFARVDFDMNSPRGGLLTQPGFLTGHSSSNTTTSPILRGIFVLERLMCFHVAMPPPGAEATVPPEPAVQPVTTRDMFTWKTSMSECQSCHRVINPMGWAFEGFDAIGRYRTMENGAPIDASGTAIVSGMFEFDGARSLSSQLLESESLYTCYAQNWLEYAYGRPADDHDAVTLSELASGFSEAPFGAHDAMVSLAVSPRFRAFAESRP